MFWKKNEKNAFPSQTFVRGCSVSGSRWTSSLRAVLPSLPNTLDSPKFWKKVLDHNCTNSIKYTVVLQICEIPNLLELETPQDLKASAIKNN